MTVTGACPRGGANEAARRGSDVKGARPCGRGMRAGVLLLPGSSVAGNVHDDPCSRCACRVLFRACGLRRWPPLAPPPLTSVPRATRLITRLGIPAAQ
jgi:hypothetical protein